MGSTCWGRGVCPKENQDPVPRRRQGKVDSEWAEGHSCPAHGHLAVGTVRPTTVPLSGPHETP